MMSKKHRFTKVIACAMAAVMMLSPLSANAAWKNEKKPAVVTSITSEQGVVTVSLKLEKNTNITDGQAVIYYDKNVMDLQWASSYNYFDMEDVNYTYEKTEDGRIGIGFAWVGQNSPKKYGEIFTASFTVKNPKDSQKIKVETAFKSAHAKDVELLSGEESSTVTTKLSIKPVVIGNVTVPAPFVNAYIGFKTIFGKIIGRFWP